MTIINTLQSKFYDSVANPFEMRRLFDQIPGILFFLKDSQSRLMAANQGVLNRMGVHSEAEVIGSSDYDYFPRELADGFVKDDQFVLKTGTPIVNRLEIAYDEHRVLGWHLTTKLPIHGTRGKIVGVMGFTHSYDEKHPSHGPFAEVAKAVDFVRENYHRKFNAKELAKAGGMSERSLNRRFHDAFQMTPHEFISRTRIQAASKALVHSELSLSDIALDCGFCDQSAFTVQFRKRQGVTPREFRQRYRRF